MKKIILSVAVAAMALTTTASALEDIKVNGQAKLWYETNDSGDGLMKKDGASGEVAFKLGMTGKQGNVGFGTTVYQTSTMGLENFIVSSTRTATTHAGGAVVASSPTTNSNTSGSMYVGEAYVTAPMGADTILKFGKQELDTPLLFTERWNVAPNTFNAAVAINKSVQDLTLIAAYAGQTNASSWAVDGEVVNQINGGNGAYAFGALYKTDALAVNAWYYALPTNTDAVWVDAGMKVADIGLKAYFTMGMPEVGENTMAYAASADTAVNGIKLFAAASMVSDKGQAGVNLGTGKKTKLPTAGVYTDGVYVTQAESMAIKVKAAGKVGSTGVALQAISNSGSTDSAKETTEIDLIVTQKLGDFNIKGIVMNRSFTDADSINHIRAIVSLNF